MSQCHGCSETYPEEQMADWTICFGCKQSQMEEYHGEPVYMDALGIAWTQAELEEAGGKEAVDRLVEDADVRSKHYNEK